MAAQQPVPGPRPALGTVNSATVPTGAAAKPGLAASTQNLPNPERLAQLEAAVREADAKAAKASSRLSIALFPD